MPLFRSLDIFPDPLALHHLNPARYPYVLESVVQGTPNARYSLVFAFPGETLTLSPGEEKDFLEELDACWNRERLPVEVDSPLPFRGGWFVYLGYELAGQIEPGLRLPPAPGGLPVAFATRIPAALILDHQLQQAWLMAEAGCEGLLDLMAADLATLVPIPPEKKGPGCEGAMREDDPVDFLAAVERIKHYIREGDVFQVNLSRAWQGRRTSDISTLDLYRRLRRRNPAPFAGLVRWQDMAIISSSPERLVRVQGRVVETRPIAGTRPRGAIRDADLAFSRELLGHPKERAEHVMLIDLERNDLGRVCRPGTVSVDELMVLESYAHVHHIVSNVRGELSEGVTPGKVIRAVFPGGTITGCPKVRCMEIIAELEGIGRGAYTGSMGYLNRDGGMDLNILIRTLVQDGSRLLLRAGGGIVADSIPERELEETRAKALGLLLALRDE